MKHTSNTKPSKFTFEHYPRGGYILWLREIPENPQEVVEPNEQGEIHTMWIYNEYTMFIPNPISNEFIEQHFDEYLREAKRKEATETDKRLSSLEGAVADILRLIGGTTQ